MDVDKNLSLMMEILEDAKTFDAEQESSESVCNNTIHSSDHNSQEDGVNDNAEKPCAAVWTTDSTLTLLKLYEDKLEMLETPKKKTRIWMAITESLKQFNIEMTPDQVRWKINALTKKYKQCIDNGEHEKFKYFYEMDNIYSQYNVDNDAYTIAELLQKKKKIGKNYTGKIQKMSLKPKQETKAMIELRKTRLANRIESDRSQSKIHLENQWLQYLKKQEEQKLLKDEMFEKNLKLKEEQIKLRKRAIEIKNSIDLHNMEMWERKQETLLSIEKEKFELLKKMLSEY